MGDDTWIIIMTPCFVVLVSLFGAVSRKRSEVGDVKDVLMYAEPGGDYFIFSCGGCSQVFVFVMRLKSIMTTSSTC